MYLSSLDEHVSTDSFMTNNIIRTTIINAKAINIFTFLPECTGAAPARKAIINPSSNIPVTPFTVSLYWKSPTGPAAALVTIYTTATY